MWKDLDILSQNIENLTQNTGPNLPFQFMTPPTKQPTIVPFIKNIEYSSSFNNDSRTKFLINSTGFLDPYYFFLEVVIKNNNDSAIYVEKNYLQLLSKIIITTNGNVIEEIDKADYINDLLIDLNLSNDDLNRFRHFGFYQRTPPLISGINSDSSEMLDTNPERGCAEYGVEKIFSSMPEQKILIPIPSRYFGFGQDFNSYKFIPLERFPNLEIEIHLTKSSILLARCDYPTPVDTLRVNFEPLINLQITKLITRQLYFDSSALEYVKKYYKSDLILENTMYSVSTVRSYNSFPSELEQLILHHRQSLKKIYYLFYVSQESSTSSIQSKYNRLSPHITEMQARCADDYYPEIPIKGLSSSTVGMNNNTQFLAAFNNSHYITISNQMKNAIDSLSFARNNPFNNQIYDFPQTGVNSHMMYACNYNCGKSLFCFDFESIPFSGMTFRNGIDTRFNKPVFVKFKFDNAIANLFNSVVKIDVVPILEYDSILKVAENGYITKEF